MMISERLPDALILAAGFGTRLQPFTHLMAKPLVPLMGVPTVQYLVDGFLAFGVRHVLFNMSYQTDQMRRGLSQLNLGKARMTLLDESKGVLGTAGGVVNALPYIESDEILLATSDMLTNIDWSQLVHAHRKLKRKYGVRATMAIAQSHQNESYSTVQIHSQQPLIQGFGSRAFGKPFYVGSGVYDRTLFEFVSPGKSELIPDILESAIQKKEVGVYHVNAPVWDIGSPHLWHQTHLDWISYLETSGIPGPQGKFWGKRVEQASKRIRKGVWVSKLQSACFFSENWQGPSYWGGWETELQPPAHLGSRSVVYGNGKRLVDCPTEKALAAISDQVVFI